MFKAQSYNAHISHQHIKYVAQTTSEKKRTDNRLVLDKSAFLKYIIVWVSSFILFFAISCITMIVKENSIDAVIYKTLKDNSTLSLLVSLLFSVLTELFWEGTPRAVGGVPQKVVLVLDFMLIIFAFVLYNTYEVIQAINATNVVHSIQFDINLALTIAGVITSIASFIVLSFRSKY